MSILATRTARVKSASTEAIQAARQSTPTSRVLFDATGYRERLPYFGNGIEEYFAEIESVEVVEEAAPEAVAVEPSPALRVDSAHKTPAPHFGRGSDVGPSFSLAALPLVPEVIEHPTKLTREMTPAEFSDFLNGFTRKIERNKAARPKSAVLEDLSLPTDDYWIPQQEEEDAWLDAHMPGDVLEEEMELRLGRA